MTFTTVLKRVLSILFVVMLMFSVTVLAEEAETDFAQDKNPAATAQPALQAKPIGTPAKEKEGQQEQQTLSSSKSETSTAASIQGGEKQESFASEDEARKAPPGEDVSAGMLAPPPTEEVGESDPAEEEAPTPTTEEETLPPQTLSPEDTSVWISLEWECSSEDGLLRAGDAIALAAKITTEAESLPLQWQVAAKLANALAENESEWKDVPGANGEKYPFTVQEGMQSWRWRLCVKLPNGEVVYSSEISLPTITIEEEGFIQTEDVEAFSSSNTVPPLPIADVTLTADIPLEGIAYGDEVTLVADIHNPREGMFLQWQHMPAEMESDKSAWESVEGANESSCTYVVSEENVEWIWRLLITVPEVIAEPEGEVSAVVDESASEKEADAEVSPEQPASGASENETPVVSAPASTLDTTEAHPEESLAETAETIETAEE